MTTVAYRDGVLAADTMVIVGNGSNDGSCVKIAKAGPFLAGVSGCWPIALAFLDWFRRGLPPDATPNMQSPTDKDEYAIGRIFTPEGRILTFSNVGWSWRDAPFYAIGSGQDYALGAMAMGASAEESVRIAMRFDTGTGGEVMTLRADHGVSQCQV